MVALKDVKASNAALRNSHESLTAVFVGATSGIGLATLKAFAKYIPVPRAIIVGRSRSKFQPELDNLRSINPDGEYIFFETEVALIKNIDAVCKQIVSYLGERRVDLLYTSQGYINFGARDETEEGLDKSIATRYYGRVRFTQNLLPQMSAHARAVTILAGGQEGKIFEDDLDLKEKKNWGVVSSAGHFASLLTLSYDALAEANPEKGFVHVFPGLVRTGLLGNSTTGLLGLVMRWVVQPLLGLFVARGVEEMGERMLFYGTAAEYAEGSWALDWDGTSMEVEALKGYRERGMAREVGEFNEGLFKRVTKV